MKRLLHITTSALILLSLTWVNVSAQIWVPDGLRIPGSWNEYANSVDMEGDFALLRTESDTTIWQTSFQWQNETSSQIFKFASGGENPWHNQWTLGVESSEDNVQFNTVEYYYWHPEADPAFNRLTVTQERWYTINWKDNGYDSTQAIVMETMSEPVSIEMVSAGDPEEGNVTVNIELSGDKSEEEQVIVFYSEDDFANTSHVMATGEGASWTAVIPEGVLYSVITSTVQPGETFDGDYALIALHTAEGGMSTNNEGQENLNPNNFQLDQNYPNPFNPATNISFTLAEASTVTLQVFNLLGQTVATLVDNKRMTSGTHSLVFDAKNLPSGVYIYRMSTNNSITFTRKMMLIK